MNLSDPVVILLVEDDPGDVELMREGLRDAQVSVALNVVEDGERAMRFLRREAEYASAERPHLIVLDLNMPRKSGVETLSEIKSDPQLKEIPVVILTSSEAQVDVHRCYLEGANCYLVKPIGFEAFIHLVHAIEKFWLTVAKLPDKG